MSSPEHFINTFLVLKPAVVSFIDIVTRVGDVDFDIEEVKVRSDSKLVGRTLQDAGIREKTGLIVLAVQRQGQTKMRFNPTGSERLEDNDTLIVLGETDRIQRLKNMI